jgi:hypothetical protein
MSVVTLVVPGAREGELRELQVEGSTYDPSAGGVLGASSPLDASLLEVSRVATLCNECDVELKDGVFKVTRGAMTEPWSAIEVLVGFDRSVGTQTAHLSPVLSAHSPPWAPSTTLTLHLASGLYQAVGQPTEAALRVVADKLLADQETETFGVATRYWAAKHGKEATLEFDRSRKRMSVIVSAGVKVR